MSDSNKSTVYICEALVLISYLALISISVFEVFTQVSLYILLFVAAIIIVLRNKLKINNAVYIVIVGFYLLFSVLITSGGLGSILTYILPIILLFQFEQIYFSKKTCNNIRILSVVVLACIFIRSFSYARDWNYHRFNDINPNTMSMYLLLAYMYCISLMNTSGKYKKLKILLLTGISLWALYNYDSRASMLVLVLFFFVTLFVQKMSIKTIYKMAVFFLILGLLFPVIYLYLYKSGVSLVVLGKSLYTGREIIWGNMFDIFNQTKISWLVGLGSKVSLWGDRTLNVHNNYYAIIVDFGLIGFLLFYTLIFRKLRSIKSNSAVIKKLLLSFVFFTFLLGLTEVTTLWPTTCVLTFLNFGMALSIDRYSRGNFYEK